MGFSRFPIIYLITHKSKLTPNYLIEAVIPAGIAGIQTPWMTRILPAMAQDTLHQTGRTHQLKLVGIQDNLLVHGINLFRNSVKSKPQRHPLQIDAWGVLPEYMHMRFGHYLKMLPILGNLEKFVIPAKAGIQVIELTGLTHVQE